MAGEGGRGVIISIAVGIRATLLEDGWVVLGPLRTLAGLRLVVRATAAVLVSVEGETS